MEFPLRFVPQLRPMVWGGRRLGELLGKHLPTDEPYGESWEVSDHPLHRSIAANGPATGRTLHELMATQAEAILGPATARQFPWLIKFLDCHDWLSVQVHPDAKTVQRLLPGEGSKTEAWFVLHAEPGSRIYAGLVPGTDEARLRRALREGNVADCLHHFAPRPGDCIYLPAGTVHAVGGGVLLAEVQQTSDATFRLFDWNRRDAQGRQRPLHIEEAIASIDWNRGPVEPVHAAGFMRPDESVRATERQQLVQSPYFALEYVQSCEPLMLGGTGRLRALIVVRGQGRWASPSGSAVIERGQVWVLPAALPPIECSPQGVLGAVLCTLP